MRVWGRIPPCLANACSAIGPQTRGTALGKRPWCGMTCRGRGGPLSGIVGRVPGLPCRSGRGAAETGAHEEVGEDRIVLHEFKGKAAEVIARGRLGTGRGHRIRFREGKRLTAGAGRDRVADVR